MLIEQLCLLVDVGFSQVGVEVQETRLDGFNLYAYHFLKEIALLIGVSGDRCNHRLVYFMDSRVLAHALKHAHIAVIQVTIGKGGKLRFGDF